MYPCQDKRREPLRVLYSEYAPSVFNLRLGKRRDHIARNGKAYRSLTVTRWGSNETKYTKAGSKWVTIVNIVW